MPTGIDYGRMLVAVIAPIDGIAPEALAPERRGGDVATDGTIIQLTLDHPTVGRQRNRLNLAHGADSEPCIAPPPRRGGRGGPSGNAGAYAQSKSNT